MWPTIKDFFTGLIFDRSAGQRYMVGGTFLLGTLLASGGVIPGTDVVLPFMNDHTQAGSIIKALAIFCAAGHGLPTAASYAPDKK